MKPQDNTEKLEKLRVLVADENLHIAKLVQKILKTLGFHHIFLARDGQKAVHTLQNESIDFVITSWDMEPMSGIDFIEYIRNSEDSPNPTLPIIMLTGKSQKKDVEKARDAGMTEFIVKPFNVRTLCDRIILMVNHPRNFILTSTYRGPDRRRRSEDRDVSTDRRKSERGEIELVTESEDYKVIRVDDEDVTIMNPDYSLQEKIGVDVDINDIFSEENVRRAQEIIQNSTEQFREWIVDELKKLEEVYNVIASDSGHSGADVHAFYLASLSVKSQAGIFGYSLATCVAESLMNLTDDCPHLSKGLLIVARKHIDVLYVIFQRNIQGMGGKIGQDLMENLETLIQKYEE